MLTQATTDDLNGGAELSAASAFSRTENIINLWLLRYADELDYQLAVGYKFNRAVVMVRDRIRPKCSTCGNFIKHGGPDVLFCGRPLCKRSARRLRYFKATYGLPHHDALNIVLSRYRIEVSK